MKKIALTLAFAALAIPIFAQKAAPIPTDKKKIHCPVMTSNWVNIADALKKKMYTDYKGRRYFFCCASCPPAFKKDPEKYAKNDSLPAPKPAKPKKP